MNGDIKLEEDDNVLDVIDKVNAALRAHGLELKDDGEAHDGFVIVRLVRLAGQQ